MGNLLVVLSGNVGVGKSTIGPYLADELKASWLSESDISSPFAHLFSNQERSSRIISQIAFSSMRVATVLSCLLSDLNQIVVTERFLRDSIIYHEIWRDMFSLQDMDEFFERFYKTLGSHPVKYTSITIWLKCDIDVILSRIALRGEVFENNHTREMLIHLEEKYSTSFTLTPPENLLIFDVTNLEKNPSSLKLFASEVASKILNANYS
jgi:deoxyadenosine/deoxycytidine kinase